MTKAAAQLTSSLVCDAAVAGTILLDPFACASLDTRCAGPALTAAGAGGDNLVLYRAIEASQPGDVLVAALEGSHVAGHWGSLLTQAATAHGIAGLVIDGAVRDIAEMAEFRFPIFYRGLMPRKARKADPGRIREAIEIDGYTITDGDLVVADADGVAIVPHDRSDELMACAQRIAEREADIEQQIKAGTDIRTAFQLID